MVSESPLSPPNSQPHFRNLLPSKSKCESQLHLLISYIISTMSDAEEVPAEEVAEEEVVEEVAEMNVLDALKEVSY